MRSRRVQRRLLASPSRLALAACALNPPPHDEKCKQALPNMSPPAAVGGGGGAAAPVADNWLASFHDPAARRAGEGGDRLQRGPAHRRGARRTGRRRISRPRRPRRAAGQLRGARRRQDERRFAGLKAAFFASWELDLWGRVRDGSARGRNAVPAAELDAEYARQSIAALVAKGWILAIEARMQKAEAEALAASEQLVSLAQDRLRVGSGDEYEVAEAQASVENFRDTVRSTDLAYQKRLRALETLVGRYPAAAVTVAARLPRGQATCPRASLGAPGATARRHRGRAPRRHGVLIAPRKRRRRGCRASPRRRYTRSQRIVRPADSRQPAVQLRRRADSSRSSSVACCRPKSTPVLRSSRPPSPNYGKVGSRAFGEVEGALAAGHREGARGYTGSRSARERARARTREHPLPCRYGRSARRAAAATRAPLCAGRAAARPVRAPGPAGQSASRARRKFRRRARRDAAPHPARSASANHE